MLGYDLEEQLRKIAELAQKTGASKTYMQGFGLENQMQDISDTYGSETPQDDYMIGLSGLVSEYGMEHEASHGYMNDVTNLNNENYGVSGEYGEYTGIEIGITGGLYSGEGGEDSGDGDGGDSGGGDE